MITTSAKVQHLQLTPLILYTHNNMQVPPMTISLVIRTSSTTSDYALIMRFNLLTYHYKYH